MKRSTLIAASVAVWVVVAALLLWPGDPVSFTSAPITTEEMERQRAEAEANRLLWELEHGSPKTPDMETRDVPDTVGKYAMAGAIVVGLGFGAVIVVLVGWRLLRYALRTVSREIAAGVREGKDRDRHSP